MATKPWRKNAWSFRAHVMCNASTMAFTPGLYPPPPASPPRRRPPHIFQRLEDTKEEHALRCYADACQKYLQSKDKVKRQCGKSDQELLMENCHLYRTRLENAELLERARGVEDCHSGEQVWAMSLREHWTVEPRIGDLYSTPICYQKEGSQKEIEQIGSPYRKNLHHLLSDSSSPRNTKQLSTLTLYKRFLKKCERKLAKVKSHMPEFSALEAVNLEVTDCGWDQTTEHGPRAELSTTNLFLHGKPGDHVSSSVTLRNTGSTSLYYQWHQQPPICLVVQENCTSKNIVQAGDGHPRRASCFYIVPTAGCLVPGKSKDFYIEFHPSSPGSFMETWILHFTPKLSKSVQALHLHGAAAVPEDENSILQRKLLQQSLDIRQRTRGLEEVFGEILEKAIKQVQITFKKAPDFVISNESFNFMRSNIECFEQTPLYYNPPVLLQFEDLAVEIHVKSQANIEVDSSIGEASSSSIASTAHTWDWSVSSLILSLHNINANENWKEMMRQRVSCLQLLAAIPPHPTAVLYTAMYKALVKIASDIEEVMEERDGENVSEVSSTNEMENDSNLDSGFVQSLGRSPSNNANVGQNSGKIFGSSSPKEDFANANVGQVEAVKASQGIGDANAGQINLLKNMGSSPSKQVVANGNVRQADSLKSSSSKQVTASAKDEGAAKNPDSGIAEQAHVGKMEESTITCERRVSRLLQEGVVEQFLNNVEGAFAKLVPVVQKKIECCMAEGDENSASWLFLWCTRLSHALDHY